MQDDQTVEPAKPGKGDKRKSGRLWVWLGGVLALGVVAVGAFEYTSTPGFCQSCHEIKPTVEGWRASAHAEEAECMDCHAEPGFIGELVSHLGGVQEAYVHFTEKPTPEDIEGLVPTERCLACHEEDWAELPEDHPTREAPCAVCHRDSAHTNEKPLYVAATEGEVAAAGPYSCIDCHTDRALLKADLKADPLPEKVKAESEGEG